MLSRLPTGRMLSLECYLSNVMSVAAEPTALHPHGRMLSRLHNMVAASTCGCEHATAYMHAHGQIEEMNLLSFCACQPPSHALSLCVRMQCCGLCAWTHANQFACHTLQPQSCTVPPKHLPTQLPTPPHTRTHKHPHTPILSFFRSPSRARARALSFSLLLKTCLQQV